MLTMEKARVWLRYGADETHADALIEGLLEAIPHYIEATTGMTPEQQDKEPLAETAAKFLLMLWFDDQYHDAGLQRGIDNLLKVLTVKARRTE